MSTKVIDETTLRIYLPKASNIEPVSQDLPFPTITPSKSIVPERTIEVKDKEEAVNTQGFSLWLIIYHPDVLWCIFDNTWKYFHKFLFNFQTKKLSSSPSALSGRYEVYAMSSISLGLKGILDINSHSQI